MIDLHDIYIHELFLLIREIVHIQQQQRFHILRNLHEHIDVKQDAMIIAVFLQSDTTVYCWLSNKLRSTSLMVRGIFCRSNKNLSDCICPKYYEESLASQTLWKDGNR